MFKFFKNLFKKKKTVDTDEIKQKLEILNAQRGVEVSKIDSNMYSIEIDKSMSNMSIHDILRIIEGE
jgi:hypothetical protein